MSRVPEVGKKVRISGLVHPNIPHLEVGYDQFTNHLLTSWDIQVWVDFCRGLLGKNTRGYNSTIFAYGQTGSGKTHTMMFLGEVFLDRDGIVIEIDLQTQMVLMYSF